MIAEVIRVNRRASAVSYLAVSPSGREYLRIIHRPEYTDLCVRRLRRRVDARNKTPGYSALIVMDRNRDPLVQ